MNKLAISLAAFALMAAVSGVQAKGGMGHISTGPVSQGGFTLGAAPKSTGATASAQAGSGIKPSHTHVYGLLDTSSGAQGIIPGVGNSLGSASSLRGKSLGAGHNDVGRIANHLSRTNSTATKGSFGAARAGQTMPGALVAQKHSATVLGVSRAPKTGEVCIWGTGTDGTCH